MKVLLLILLPSISTFLAVTSSTLMVVFGFRVDLLLALMMSVVAFFLSVFVGFKNLKDE